jgi:pyruvate formate lyase activating enzyme
MVTGTIFDIKRFSIHDGPGIRSTVFLKGCPLVCQWCHNPESQSFQPELIFRPDRCLACGACVDDCPHGNIQIIDGKIAQNKSDCLACGACCRTCYPGARELIGREVTPEEVLKEVIRDNVFYQESGGGVTFSGGEPLSQADFLEECLALSKETGLSTALDTCGYGSWGDLQRQLPYLDLVLFDLKVLNDDLHQKYTGISNQDILENFHQLCSSDLDVVVRRPVIPGVNDSEEEIQDLGEFLIAYNGKIKIDLLPYHSLSADKYLRLGREGEEGEWEKPSEIIKERIMNQLMELGIEVGWGG